MATDEQKNQTLDNAIFDQKIISGISNYDSLVNFLFTHRDTIIAHRNSRNVVIQVEGGGRKDTVLEKEDCYTFFQGNGNYDISNVPDFLKLELARLFNGLNIISFKLCLTGNVEIEIKSEKGNNGLYATHKLIWNTKSQDSNPYSRSKDTLINDECIYRIVIDEHHGH